MDAKAQHPLVPVIKPEPHEARMPPLNGAPADAFGSIKPEPGLESDFAGVKAEDAFAPAVPDFPMDEPIPAAGPAHVNGGAPAPAAGAYTRFGAPGEIAYTPEAALHEGLQMVGALRAGIRTLELGNKMRKDVWMRELESLQQAGAPTTMVAVCGATGAGKSSTLNAILDDNIVPTSGMRACTAVVTEISFKEGPTIEGDVSFLSEKEWRDEIDVLLSDLIDEDGTVKRATDLRSDAGIAWSKLHAVYPAITQDMLSHMTVDQIVQYDPRISRLLGTTKHIVAPNSKVFAEQIGQYIDSKEKKRGGKDKGKGKDKEPAKDKPPVMSSLMALVKKNAAAGNSRVQKDKESAQPKKKDQFDPDGPAYWPLIRQVRVRCQAEALRTGAILVDLPGVADANAARNSIAKDYMKKCDCIWILAPITRAVDDKTARDLLGDAFKMQLMMDGNYDPSTITFVATKCDDISCSEVIPALGIDDDPELLEIESRIDDARDEMKEARERKEEADTMVKEIDSGLKQVREMDKEFSARLKAAQAGESYKPPTKGAKVGEKRKRGGSKEGSSKRRKADDSDDDSEDDSDIEIEDADSDTETKSEGGVAPADSSDVGSGEDEEEEEEEEPVEELSVDELKEKIKETKEAIKVGREQLNLARQQRKEASDAITKAKRDQAAAQKDKNAFCSLKRSAYSQGVLKEDFRTGLKDLDDAAAEERDPNSFDPTIDLRNYAAIDMPVFTVSSRDYVRIKGQVKGDGDPTCFTDTAGTGIPDLQRWCHSLTVSSRERSARNFFKQLNVFAEQVRTYVTGIGDVTAADRLALREKWESALPGNDDPEDEAMNDDPYADAGYAMFGARGNLYDPPPKAAAAPQPAKREVKYDAAGNMAGIAPRLAGDFVTVVDGCITDLNRIFRDGLEEKCTAGAKEASVAAVQTHDTFASGIHWATYRATLRRLGEWRFDLNAELTAPMTRQIAASWAKVFEADMFAAFQQKTESVVQKLVEDVENSAPVGLKDKVRLQGESAMNEARLALQNSIVAVKAAMDSEQKEISRCLAPHVQNQLRETYLNAMEERGKGSVARQKGFMHDDIERQKDQIFNAGSELLLGRLSEAADAVGAALDTSLGTLAEKVETNLSVLWEEYRDSPAQVRARADMVDRTSEILALIAMWSIADKARVSE